MKKVFVLFFGLVICSSIQANPLSKTCQFVHADLAFDFFTTVNLYSESLWYATIRPAYQITYQLNLVSERNNLLQRFSIKAGCFFSDMFNSNSVQLDKGEVNVSLIHLELEYLRYLPVITPVAFVVGCTIAPRYTYFGQRIAPGKAFEINDVYADLGPVCGFSFYKTDFVEFTSLLGINIGLPVYSEQIFPDGTRRNRNYFALNGTFRNSIIIMLDKFSLGLAYDFCLDYNLNAEILTHSFSLLGGVVF